MKHCLTLFLPRSIHLPSGSANFTGYNDWKKKRIKKPRLSCEDLQQHEEKPSSLLSQSWFVRKLFVSVRSDTERLLCGIHQYKEYLKQQTATMQQVHNQTQPRQHPENYVSINLLPIVNACNSDYAKISDVLSSKSDYFPVCVNNFTPSDHYTRCHWIDKLGFPYKVMIMEYQGFI